MAGIRRTFRKDGTPHKRLRYWYVDYKGKRRWATGTKNAKETKRLAEKFEQEQREIRLGLRAIPNERKNKLFSEVREEYLEWGTFQGGRRNGNWSPVHKANRARHLTWWEQYLGLITISDIEERLADIERGGRELSKSHQGKTVSNYVESLRALVIWCEKRGYLSIGALQGLKLPSSEPAVKRRALTLDEIELLFTNSSRQNRLLYRVALVSGLRANELRSLCVRDLDAERCGLHLCKTWTKNRRDGFQPIPPELCDLLVSESKGKELADRLLRVPSHPARTLDRDLKRAGILKETVEGRVDFHALRTTFATLLIESGSNVKEVQELLRHASPNITMDMYARTRPHQLRKVVTDLDTRLIGNEGSDPDRPQQVTFSPVAGQRHLLCILDKAEGE